MLVLVALINVMSDQKAKLKMSDKEAMLKLSAKEAMLVLSFLLSSYADVY
jgi:hypothetical protein